MDRKGEATDVLMTYGWAVLAVILALGILEYFMLNPGRLVANSCTFGGPFNCNGANVNVGGSVVSIELGGGGGEIFDVTNISVAGCGDGGSNSSVGIVRANDMKRVEIPCEGLIKDTTFKGDVKISYKKLGSNLEQVATGRVIQRL
jgi:hypothetical protein